MAVSYGFFDGGTEYGQDEFNQYFDAFLRSGVKVEDEVEEEAGAEAGDEAGNSKCYMGLEVTTDGKNNITVGTGTADSAGILDEEFGAAESGSGQKPGKLCAYCGSSGQKGAESGDCRKVRQR